MKLTVLSKVKNFFSKKKIDRTNELEKQWQELLNIEKEIQQETQKIAIYNDWWTTSKMIKFWLIWLLMVLLWYFWYSVLNIIFLIISAYIVSIIVESLVSYFEKKWLKRSLSLLISYVIFVVVILGVIIILIPFLLNQISDLLSMGMAYVSHMQTEITTKWIETIIMESSLWDWIKDLMLNYISNNDVILQLQTVLQENLWWIISTWQSYLTHIWSWVLSFFSGFASIVINFLLFLTLCILFSADKKNVTKFLSKLWWKDKEKIVKLKIEKVYKNLAVWLKARLLLSLFIAFTVWLALVVMWRCGVEIPSKLWIAILTWLLDIIPYIWPIVTAVLLFMVAVLYNSFWVAVLIVVILYVLNFVQENILTPILMKKALWISPVLILISLMLWWVLMWFMWVLLAVPISAILVIFFWNGELEPVSQNNFIEEVKLKVENIKNKNEDLANKKN